jgi:hypothetical protein
MSRKVSRRAAIAGLAVGTTLLGNAALAQRTRVKRHPRLERAIDDMKDARDYLREAPSKFGGHKAKAMEALNVAIDQLRKAIQFDS